MAGQAALFFSFFPLTYKLAIKVRPVTLAMWTAGYYFGVYKSGFEPLVHWRF
jgi:hypothetical protein